MAAAQAGEDWHYGGGVETSVIGKVAVDGTLILPGNARARPKSYYRRGGLGWN